MTDWLIYHARYVISHHDEYDCRTLYPHRLVEHISARGSVSNALEPRGNNSITNIEWCSYLGNQKQVSAAEAAHQIVKIDGGFPEPRLEYATSGPDGKARSRLKV